jgi:hypothetical protein
MVLVYKHICYFQVKENHCLGRYFKYLNSKLTVKKRYSLLRDLNTDRCIKYELYNKVFRKSFDFNFGQPQVDTFYCCEKLRIKLKSKNLNDAAEHVPTAELLHKRRTKKFYSALKTSQE